MGMAIDPDTEITVTCGSTEAMMSSVLTVADPGDKIEQDIRDNSFKLLSPQAQRAARVSGRAVEVSAADFDEG